MDDLYVFWDKKYHKNFFRPMLAYCQYMTDFLKNQDETGLLFCYFIDRYLNKRID